MKWSQNGGISFQNSAESKGRAGSSNPDRLYISMAERMEQRKQRRQELEMRYECARKQQEVIEYSHILSFCLQLLSLNVCILELSTVVHWVKQAN